MVLLTNSRGISHSVARTATTIMPMKTSSISFTSTAGGGNAGLSTPHHCPSTPPAHPTSHDSQTFPKALSLSLPTPLQAAAERTRTRRISWGHSKRGLKKNCSSKILGFHLPAKISKRCQNCHSVLQKISTTTGQFSEKKGHFNTLNTQPKIFQLCGLTSE